MFSGLGIPEKPLMCLGGKIMRLKRHLKLFGTLVIILSTLIACTRNTESRNDLICHFGPILYVIDTDPELAYRLDQYNAIHDCVCLDFCGDQ